MADFRSDTMTQPTPRMREAMARAEVGDDVFREDPTINRLEEVGAAFLGKPAALFVPSGTMGNQASIHVHCRPGDELICEERSHVVLYEAGSVARLSGTQIRTLVASDGFPEPEQVAAAVRTPNVHHPRSRLLVIENTHNLAGGTVLGASGMHALVAEAHGHGLAVHIDGARLVNAAVAAGCEAADLVGDADSVSMCLSKGLGAPVGSLIAGSVEFVESARGVRKAFGGAMRQAGVLAAAGLIALEEGPSLVAEDHRRAAELARALAACSALVVKTPQTNIVVVELPEHLPSDLITHLAKHGVHILALGPRLVRFVTHRDVTDEDVQRCREALPLWKPASAGAQTATTNRN